MKAALFGIAALTLGSVALAAPASALPYAGGVAGVPAIEKAYVVSRTVRRGPFCKTVVTRKVGPMGGMRVIRRKTCR